ncbi:MAG TPA: BA14K family protein, partial [Bradyrhizobium sp.]|nr:BA14K family protein [Bradyrhizobium sp.]
MISLKVLSTAAAMALVLPMVAPAASFAQSPLAGKPGVAAPAAGVRAGGGGAPRMGGGGGFHPGGGGGGVHVGGGAPGPR